MSRALRRRYGHAKKVARLRVRLSSMGWYVERGPYSSRLAGEFWEVVGGPYGTRTEAERKRDETLRTGGKQ